MSILSQSKDYIIFIFMTYYVTKEGLVRLKKELEELKTVKRKELAEKLQRSTAYGDLSENAEYQEAKEEQAFMEGRIAELEAMVEQTEIIAPHSGGEVAIGSTVIVEREDHRSKQQTFTIVGFEEARPEEGKISNESPVGKALLGRKPGQVVEVLAPAGKAKWRIVAVR